MSNDESAALAGRAVRLRLPDRHGLPVVAARAYAVGEHRETLTLIRADSRVGSSIEPASGPEVHVVPYGLPPEASAGR